MGTETIVEFSSKNLSLYNCHLTSFQDKSDGSSDFERNTKKQKLGNLSVARLIDSEDDNCALNTESDYIVAVNDLCDGNGIGNLENVEEGIFDKIQSSFRDFFDGLSNFGAANHGSRSTSVAAGMTNIVGGLAPGANTGVAIVRTICAQLASVFQSSSEEIARTAFAGVCIISTAIRTALPIALEVAKTAKNQEEIFIFSVAAAVMASVYLVTSSISVLLASHHAISNSPSTAAMAKKVKKEADQLHNEKNEIFLKAAQESLKKIGGLLMEWQANVRINLLSLGREFCLFVGAAISAVSALSKFAPVLTVPFVSIITGSISLIANVAEMAQGIVEYRSQKAKLEELNSKTDYAPETQLEKEKLENQLKLSKVRIVKGALNVLISVANVVFGTLTVLTSFSMPIVPAILTAVSLTTVLILSIASLVVRKANNAATAEGSQDSTNRDAAYQDTSTNETESEEERNQEEKQAPSYV